MDERRARGERLHQRVVQLLPWYGNGTLDAAEARRVEDHLASCPRCREELAASRELAKAFAAGAEAAPSPHPVQLARLWERIDAADGDERRAPSWWRRFAGLAGATPPAVRGLVAAQLAALIVLAVVLVWQTRAPAVFHTLSTAEPSAPGAVEEGPVAPGTLRLRVVFADGTSERALREVFSEVHGQIVAGPSPLGAYTIEILPGADSQNVVVDHLRARSEVTFVEPVDGGRGTADER